MFTSFIVLGMAFCVVCLLGLAFLHGVNWLIDLGNQKNGS